MNLVILGLSITSSWGNGHATTYRALVREFARRGHRVTFLERDVPYYASQRDLADFPFADVHLYRTLDELRENHRSLVASADAVMVGSYVPDGVAVADWVLGTASGVTAFYDIDTPVTLARLAAGEPTYLEARQIARFQLYLSFAGGRSLDVLEKRYRSPAARPLYCSVDPDLYFPEDTEVLWDMGYLGTYSPDRQPGLVRMLVDPARRWPGGRFIVAGPQYPPEIAWPVNVERVEHLPPSAHRRFYNQQRFTLNVTRADMIAAGHSPSVRLFEAAACGTPIVSDLWDGLADFLTPGEEILIAPTCADALGFVRDLPPERAAEIGAAARNRVLASHTAAHRAAELEGYLQHAATPRLTGMIA